VKKRRHLLLAPLILGVNLLGFSQASIPQPELAKASQVLLLNFFLQVGKLTFDSASLLPGPMKQPRELPPESWRIEVYDGHRRLLLAAAFPNPTQINPLPNEDATIPFTIRVPFLPTAKLVIVSNERGEGLHAQPLTAHFLRSARRRGDAIKDALRANQQKVDRFYQLHGGRPGYVSEVDVGVSDGGNRWAGDREADEGRHLAMVEQLELVRQDEALLKRLESASATAPTLGPPAVSLLSGGVLSGKVVGPSGNGVPGVPLSSFSQETTVVIARVTTDAGGSYSMSLPSGIYSLRVEPPASLRLMSRRIDNVSITGNHTLNFMLEAGVGLTSVVTDLRGAPVTFTSLTVRDQVTGEFVNSGRTDAQGRVSVLVTPGLRKMFVYPPSGGQLSGRLVQNIAVTNDTMVGVTLGPSVRLSGTVSDSTGAKVSQGTVYAIDHLAQKTFASANLQPGGTYSLMVAPGDYDLLIVPSLNRSPRLLAKLIENVPLSSEKVLDVTVDTGGVTLKGFVRDDAGAGGTASTLIVFDQTSSAIVSTGSSNLDGSYSLLVPRGSFRITVTPSAGSLLAATKFFNIAVSGDTQLDLKLARGRAFRGRIVSGSGTPVASARVEIYDDANSAVTVLQTPADGSFSLTIPISGRIFISPPANTNLVANAFDIEELVGEPPYTIKLNELARTTTADQVVQVFGGTERNNRVNLVFVGDGYTSRNETFGDTNGNGRWDGDVFLDVNGNGMYDAGEPFLDRNGNRQYDPPEPFQDANRDGVFNFDEPSRFDRNVLDYARLLLGMPPWKEYASFVNIFAIRLASNQAGGDVPDIPAPIVRDTVLDGKFLRTDYSMSANTMRATEIVQALVPQFDHICILLHSPWGVGRANANFGGSMRLMGGDMDLVRTIIAHEFGHSFGYLADEYVEPTNLIYPFPSSEPLHANITTVTDRNSTKWKTLISPDMPIPSPNEARGVGLFEGGALYAVGVYRPQHNCMMRFNTPRYCAVCAKQMLKRFLEETGVTLP
jgi:hypothetical protein